MIEGDNSAFLANMNHEIRTPLNAVLGFIQLLGETSLTPQQRDYLAKATGSAQDLQRIIDDLLDFSKLKAQEMKVDCLPFALGEIFERLDACLAGKAAEKGLKLRFEGEPGLPSVFLGDPFRLGQVLRALGTHAVKFTPQGEVKVSVGGEPGREGWFRLAFRVSDTGTGLPGTERVPEACFTLADDAIYQRFGGSGLGLALAYRLAELMGGGIEGEFRSGLGCAFTLTLELRFSETLPALPDPPAVSSLHAPGGTASAPLLAGAALLLVEDDPLNRQVAWVILQRAGATVTLARDGVEAVEQVRRGGFDAVVMDLQMPGMGGYSAARQIRANAGGGAMPIIALTADAVVEVRDRVLAAGMDDCLSKPIDPSLLVRTVARHLKRSEKLGQELDLGEGCAGPTDEPAVASALQSLRGFLEKDDVQARQSFLELEALARGGPLEEALAPLRPLIEIYAYPKALVELGAFTKAWLRFRAPK